MYLGFVLSLPKDTEYWICAARNDGALALDALLSEALCLKLFIAKDVRGVRIVGHSFHA